MQPQCQSQLILEVVFVTILFVSYLYDYFRPLLHLLLTIKFRRIYQHIVTAEAKNIEFTQFAVDMSHFFLAGKSCFLCARFQLFIIQLLNLVSVVIRMRKLNTGSISGQLTGVSLARPAHWSAFVQLTKCVSSPSSLLEKSRKLRKYKKKLINVSLYCASCQNSKSKQCKIIHAY